MDFVEVEWDDAWVDDDNFQSAHAMTLTHQPMRVRTRGWLIVDDATGVSLANEISTEITSGAEVFRGRTFILRSMVRSVTPYKMVKARKPKAKVKDEKVQELPKAGGDSTS